MKVIIDTTTLVSDLRLGGSHFATFLQWLKAERHELVVPAVSVEETVNKFSERHTELLKSARQAERDLRVLLGTGDPLLRSPDEKQEIARYRLFLSTQLAKMGARIAAFPSVSHEAVVERALARKKPFATSGAGYGDFLIWRTIVAEAATGDFEVVFVTNNARDFAEGAKLHPDLLADLRSSGIDPSRVTWIASIRDFNERYILPRLREEEALKAELVGGTAADASLRQWATSHLDDLLTSEDLLLSGEGLEPGIGYASSPKLRRISEIRIEGLRDLDDDTLVATAVFVLEVGFSLTFSWEDFQRSERVVEILGDDQENEPFSSVTIERDNEFEVRLQLNLDRDTKRVESFDIDDVSARWIY
jgi:PIN domain